MDMIEYLPSEPFNKFVTSDRSIGAEFFDSMVKNLRELRQMILKSRSR